METVWANLVRPDAPYFYRETRIDAACNCLMPRSVICVPCRSIETPGGRDIKWTTAASPMAVFRSDSVKDQNGAVHDYSFDGLGRETSKSQSEG